MKILYVITRSERGGAQVHLLDLLSNLPSYCEPVVATGEPGYLAEEAARLGVPVHIVSSLKQPVAPASDLLALYGLTRLIKVQRPHLIHVHTSKAGLLGRIAGKLTGVPVVFTAHTWSFADGISGMQRKIALPLERFAGPFAHKVIAVSEANAKLAMEHAVARESQLMTIWNGIPDVPHRASPGSQEIPTLIMVARFAPQKDQTSLVRALAGVEQPWRLLFVGDGPTRRRVEYEVSQQRLGHRVEFLGDRGDVSSLLAMADVSVLSTNWEGLPLSILEAMRAGLPVVATDVGGCAEAVSDGVTGFLIPPGDVSQLGERIQLLLSSRGLRASMGRVARRRFERDFKIESMVDKLLHIYRSLAPSELLGVDESQTLQDQITEGHWVQ